MPLGRQQPLSGKLFITVTLGQRGSGTPLVVVKHPPNGDTPPHALGVSIGQQGSRVPTGVPAMGAQIDVPHLIVPGGGAPPEPAVPPFPAPPPTPPVVPPAPPTPPVVPPEPPMPPVVPPTPPVVPPTPPVVPPTPPVVPPTPPLPPVDPPEPSFPALPLVPPEPPDPPAASLPAGAKRPPHPTPIVPLRHRAAVSTVKTPVFCFIGLGSVWLKCGSFILHDIATDNVGPVSIEGICALERRSRGPVTVITFLVTACAKDGPADTG